MKGDRITLSQLFMLQWSTYWSTEAIKNEAVNGRHQRTAALNDK